MNESKAAKNAIWIIGCRIVQSVFALVINMLTARYLAPSGYGLISYATSIVAFMLPIMRLGIDNILVNEVIQYPEREGETLGTSLLLTFVSAICCIGGVASFVAIANPHETETLIVCVLYSLLLISQSLDLIQYWFQAKYLSKYTSVTILVAYIVVAAYKIFLLVTEKSVYWFAVSNAFDYAIIAVVLLIVYRIKGGQPLRFSGVAAKRLVSQSKHYILPQLMVQVYAQTGLILLKQLYDNEIAGYYSAAVAISGLTNFVFLAIIDSMRPLILQCKLDDEQGYRRNMSTLYCMIIYLAVLQSIFISVLAKPVVSVLYGSAYEPTVAPLRIIIWYTTFSYIGSVRNVWMLAEGKQRYLWIINLCGAIVNVGLNLLLVPMWGMMGAALTALVTQIFTNVIMGFIIKPIRENNRYMLKGLDPRLLKRLFTVLKRKR